jgi:glycosyltransferase involved in cell wall biosynthesis
MESLQASGTEAELFVVLVDRNYDPELFHSRLFTTVPVADISIPGQERLFFKYTILELNTAIKPFFIEYLFDNSFEKVIYLDPDIYVYQPLDSVLQRLDDYEVVVTPHITQPLEDGYRPTELDIIVAGSYNMGFIGLKASSVTKRFLEWWKRKLENQCLIDIESGVFVDQKWCELIPSFIEKTFIDRSPGLNVAYWNLIHRDVSHRDKSFFVNGTPLIFFHFSGLIPSQPIVFSKHEDRFASTGLPDVVQRIVADYVACLRRNGMHAFAQHPYAFDRFSGGTVYIDNVIRKAYLESEDIREIFGDDPFDMSRDPGFASTYNKRIFGSDNPVTSLCYSIYRGRKDLHDVFPNPRGKDAHALTNWFHSVANREYRIDSVFLEAPSVNEEPVNELGNWRNIFWWLHRVVESAGNLGNPGYVPSNHSDAQPGRIRSGMNRVLTPVVHLAAKRLRSLVSHPGRQRIKKWLQVQASMSAKSPLSPDPVSETKSNSHNRGSSNQVSPTPTGINVIGYLHAVTGVGEWARSTLRAAGSVGSAVHTMEVTDGCLSMRGEELPDMDFSESDFTVSIYHVNADQTPAVFERQGFDHDELHWNVGCWAWEATDFPDRWLSSFDFFQEIWTLSTFCQDVISRKSPIPVLRMPPCVAPEVPAHLDRRSLGLPEDKTLFLCIADFFSYPERKNPIGTLTAFQRAFGRVNDGCVCIVKISNGQARPEVMKRIYDEFSDSDSSILVIDEYLDRSRINGLINHCDCLVSLHRSEGFGLTMAEAMYMGTPVISTGWSGNTDFTTIANSLPVRYQLFELEEDIGPYPMGTTWAEPDLDHAAELMQRVVSDRDCVLALAKEGQAHIRTNYSPEAVGARILERVEYNRRLHGM